MILYVIFQKRNERYVGQYGVEAIDCMTEHDYEENPTYLQARLEVARSHMKADDIAAIDIVKLKVIERSIMGLLFPSIDAKVVDNKSEVVGLDDLIDLALKGAVTDEDFNVISRINMQKFTDRS